MTKHEGHGKLIGSLGSIRDGNCGRGIHRAEVGSTLISTSTALIFLLSYLIGS